MEYIRPGLISNTNKIYDIKLHSRHNDSRNNYATHNETSKPKASYYDKYDTLHSLHAIVLRLPVPCILMRFAGIQVWPDGVPRQRRGHCQSLLWGLCFAVLPALRFEDVSSPCNKWVNPYICVTNNPNRSNDEHKTLTSITPR